MRTKLATALDQVGFAVVGEDDHWDGGRTRSGAELLEDVETVHLREAEVEVDQIGNVRARTLDGLRAGACADDVESLSLELHLVHRGDVNVVVDEQQPYPQ